MISWYMLIPIDTLLFKGAEPMERGEHHFASSIFPPPVSTLSGAIRTLYLSQHGISFEDYRKNKVDDKIIRDIGKAGEDAPFSVLGPLFVKGEEVFVPAPYNWFEENEGQSGKFSNHYKTVVFRSEFIDSKLFKSKKKIFWVKKTKGNLKTIGGKWVRYNELIKLNVSNEIDMFLSSYFFLSESRSGIALNPNRNVIEGHLYTFTHIRLTEGTKLVFGITKEPFIGDEGILKLGAEQRFVQYKGINNIDIDFGENGREFLALSPQKCGKELLNTVVATGKIKYIGGWDLKRGFHKPTVGYYPAGSVFNKKISDNLIKIS